MARPKTRGGAPTDRSAIPVNRGAGRWLIAKWNPVSLFSLRMAHATNKGGKTLLVPTPYAFKMALIDACFRRYAESEAATRAQAVFDLIKRRNVRMKPPDECVVQNTFINILDAEREGDLPFKSTIAYREFVFYRGHLEVAIGALGLTGDQESELSDLCAHIQSLGKRGSFWQFLSVETVEGDLAPGFTVPVTESSVQGVAGYGAIQALDDFGEALCNDSDAFDRISTYGTKPVKLNEHRVLTMTALPYRIRSASRHFTWYQRIGT